MYEAVIFDLYDTLLHLDGAGILATRQQLATLAGIDPAAFALQWRLTGPDRMLGRLGDIRGELRAMLVAMGAQEAATDDALVERMANLECRAWEAAAQPYPGAIETLVTLAEQGLKLGLISNCSCQAGAVVSATGLDELMDAIVLSCEVGVTKPDPAIYRRACDRLALPPERCVYVADGAGGELDAARALGMLAIKVEHPNRRPEAGADQTYDVRITALEELPGVLARMAGPAV
jgi:putative hydrolase of the HAD superfamily